jgi:putative transposase
LPDSIQIRHLRYWVAQSGFRARVITLATTLVNAPVYTADELANLYRRRWQAELHLRSLKTHMQMDHVRSKQPATVRKEFYTPLLAYKLIRGIKFEAAVAAGVSPHELSFKGTVQSLNASWGWSCQRDSCRPTLYGAGVDDEHAPSRRSPRSP